MATKAPPARDPNIDIQPAAPADARAILDLQKSAYQREAERYNDFSIPPLTQTLEDLEKEIAGKVFLKAVVQGRIIGSVRAFQKEQTVHIGRLIVDPAHQRKGIGTRLMTAVEAAFPNAGRFELFTGAESQDNLRLYRGLGYTIFRTESLSEKVSLVFLEKHGPNL